MTSNGGEFASASTGEGIQAGERLMVSEGGSATVDFANGAVVNYTAPGVYTVNVPVVGAAGAGVGAGAASTTATVGTMLGAAALGAAAVEESGDTVPPEWPVSR
jgi:PKD repeat protein